MKQSSLLDTVDNIKEDRSPEDLLTQVMLDLGLTLDLPIETRDMRGNTVYVVASGALVACFDTDIDFSIVDDIAALSPLKLVFRDASFKTDADRINLDTRMKRISPDTTITVL
jgi:adenine-specific DNA-methyltransferase